MAYLIVPAAAVHDTGAFQLDGDAQSSTDPISPPATDDWDKVCHQANPTACAAGTNTANAAAVSWTDDGSLNASIFTGGGSKDGINVDQWAWKDGAGGLPDKDNLLHSFATRYSLTPDPVLGDSNATACPSDLPNGGGLAAKCDVLFFGSDRYDNSGDAQQGFWFFQNKITLGTAKTGGGTAFKGVHKNGDVLVISNFSNGGTTSTITVYQWDSTISGNLKVLESSDAAKCSNVLGAGDAFCGIVNPSNGTVAPWSFTDKSGLHSYLNGEFYEGGINLTALGLGDECFSSVASETRSSTSTTATLKDFVLGQFANCSVTMTTAVSSSSVNPGASVHDTVTVTGSSATKTPAGSVEFFLCSFATGSTAACDGTTGKVGTSLGSFTLAGSGATATADTSPVNTSGSPLTPGHYCFRAQWAGDANYVVDPSPLKEFSAATECFEVVQHGTSTETHPQSGSPLANTTAVSFGASVVDHAVITGATGLGDPTGTVSFSVCNPTQVSGAAGSEVCASGAGTAVSGNPVTATAVVGSEDPPQTEATSGTVTANQLGVWCFRATYTPDTGNYLTSGDATHSECFTVSDTTSYTSAQKWLPNDSVVLSSANGATPTGTLNITLVKGSSCSTGSVEYTQAPITVSAAGTFNTTNTAFFVNASNDDTYHWHVVFSSNNTFISGFDTCTEVTTIDVTN
ncbi:MAG: hypothetical protein QOI95_2759 [Acidimicrobiaceae bacterium]|jgi:hypothetical protein